MPRKENVTIQLTEKQRKALRALTGKDHRELTFEKVVAAQVPVAACVPRLSANHDESIRAPKLAANHNETIRAPKLAANHNETIR